MAQGCCCTGGKGGPAKTNLPLLCLVPIDDIKSGGPNIGGMKHVAPDTKGFSGGCDGGSGNDKIFDDAYLKKHFKLSQRALYLDPFHRPLITFPISTESNNFTIHKKQKINQMILDGILDPSEAVVAPSIFPYAKDDKSKSGKAQAKEDEDDELIYILQLPDWEFQCPVHNQTIRTPRFVWHSCKKGKSGGKDGKPVSKQGGGPTKRPKPWLLSRITDFDLLSQW